MGEEEGEEAREGGGVMTSDPIFIAMRHVQSFRNTSVIILVTRSQSFGMACSLNSATQKSQW